MSYSLSASADPVGKPTAAKIRSISFGARPVRRAASRSV